MGVRHDSGNAVPVDATLRHTFLLVQYIVYDNRRYFHTDLPQYLQTYKIHQPLSMSTNHNLPDFHFRNEETLEEVLPKELL